MFSKHHAILIAATLSTQAACASTRTPRKLLDAGAANGNAAEHNPGADRTRDLAYLAGVKAVTAAVRGRTTASEKARLAAEEQLRVPATSDLKPAQAERNSKAA
jgi:hypothetical protein